MKLQRADEKRVQCVEKTKTVENKETSKPTKGTSHLQSLNNVTQLLEVLICQWCGIIHYF